jgi:hypothetical protein
MSHGEVAGNPREKEKLYQKCVACDGKGCRCCKVIGVMETGVTVAQLEYESKLGVLRQEAGISAAMLRDGRAREMVEFYRECQMSNDQIDAIVKDVVSRSPPRDPAATPIGRLRAALGMDGGSIGEVIEAAILRVQRTQ